MFLSRVEKFKTFKLFLKDYYNKKIRSCLKTKLLKAYYELCSKKVKAETSYDL
jgi:hypothetical protein